MTALRAFLLERRRLALWLVVLALAMKALVPAGYMPAAGTRFLSIQLCSEGIPGRHDLVRTVAVPVKLAPGEHEAGDREASLAKAQGTCPFAALGHGALGGADPVLLAAALAFAVLLGFAPVSLPALRRPVRAWPPMRGPPLSLSR